VGEVTALVSRVGLGLPGVLNGPSLGVFRADTRGVMSPPPIAVSRRDMSAGPTSVAAASGRARSSSIGNSPCCSCIVEGTETWSWEFLDCNRISEAGVAGDGRWALASMFGDWFGRRAGEGFADVGFGGGPIDGSDKGSGEMESVEEPA
jgi:hypothetical protein